MPDLELLVTCEHGGNQVPAAYLPLFEIEPARTALESHRGYDPGALAVARTLADQLGARLLFSETTRLLVDLNRSHRHPRLWSEFTRGLSPEAKRQVLTEHYAPYRSAVEEVARSAVARGAFVLHVSSHSFAPVLDGVVRDADLGLLFDPGRRPEAAWAVQWRESLGRRFQGWKIRRNYPYRGTADGLTTHLRRLFPDDRYAGIELELNQKHAGAAESSASAWPGDGSPISAEHVADSIARALAEALAERR